MMESATVGTSPGGSVRTGPTNGAATDMPAYLREFYGRRLRTNKDFKTAACCTIDTARNHGKVLDLLTTDVRDGYAGCGSPIPSDFVDFKGLRILDLGCGRGADCFVLAYYAGRAGRVIGLDMTEEQLAIARRDAPVILKRFGFDAPNVEFVCGYIETCDPIPDASMDLVVSNCVINLSPLKEQVFQTIFRVLKEGGEFYISDVVADRRVPPAIRDNPELVAECLGAAAYDRDLREVIRAAGFPYIWEVKRTPIPTDEVCRSTGENVGFYSVVWRGVKLSRTERVGADELPMLEPTCEDYGQIATYRGNLATVPATFALDADHVFEAARPTPVCRNTANILRHTRLSRYFNVTPPVKHFGVFACGPTPSATSAGETQAGGCCA